MTDGPTVLRRNAAVFGVTGYAGGHIAAELLGRGFTVSGVARTAPGDIDPRIAFRRGSLHDLELVERVTADADVVVLAVRASAVAADGTSLAEAVTSLLPLVAATGARLGVVGGAGSLRIPGTDMLHMDRADYTDAPLPESRNLPEARSQAEVLGALEASVTGVDWFYVSPPAVFGSYATGTRTGSYRLGADELVLDGEGNSFISGEDFALAFVDEIERPRHHSKRFTIAY